MKPEPKMPAALTRLVETANAHGWGVVVNPGRDSDLDPYVSVELGRLNPMWLYRLTWHTRATQGKTYRLFSKIYMHKPLEGRGVYWADAPSLAEITRMITEWPVTSPADKPGVRTGR